MSKLTLAGIRRGNQFSPNHIGNDAAIFTLTAEHLRKLGCDVNEYIESDLLLQDPKEKGIFNMVRDWKSIHKLQELEDKNYFVVNSGYGIENCTREKMTRLLLSNHISHPKSLILRTDEDPTEALAKAGFYNCWVKRGDFHAIHREDVTYVRNPEEAKSILKEYAIRGISSAVINEHLVGDLVKFYGVSGTDFFYWFYPSNTHHSKFGLEVINGTAKGIPFDEAQLRQICDQAAQVLHVDIYGGDCIIAEDGIIRLIDFNDWPSFAPCREEAAPNIARRIWDLMREHI
ncbi:MAG: hypothetical protein PHC95_10255 [Parabacteroides sp.]|nr:hypothetical protein [Parabacteroides sp.]